MKVVCILDEIMRQTGHSDAELARQTKIDWRTIRKLRIDGDPWMIGRENLHRLMLFSFENGFRHGIFEVRPNQIWENFVDHDALIYREDREWDSQVERKLRAYFRTIDSKPSLRMLDLLGRDVEMEQQIAQVERDIRESNCVFLGSPKYSFGTEIALSLLWGIQPFDPSPENLSQAPVRFCGMEANHRFEKSSMIEKEGMPGFKICLPGQSSPNYVPVRRFDQVAFEAFDGEADDASVVVTCHRPLGTMAKVTSIVIAGYSGLATWLATKDLIYGEPPKPPSPDSSKPEISVLRFRYRKKPHRGKVAAGTLRRLVEGSMIWAPPWRKDLKT